MVVLADATEKHRLADATARQRMHGPRGAKLVARRRNGKKTKKNICAMQDGIHRAAAWWQYHARAAYIRCQSFNCRGPPRRPFAEQRAATVIRSPLARQKAGVLAKEKNPYIKKKVHGKIAGYGPLPITGEGSMAPKLHHEVALACCKPVLDEGCWSGALGGA